MPEVVRIYPENTREQLGATRWTVLWYELTPKAQARVEADPDYEWCPMTDVQTERRYHRTANAARSEARRLVDSGQLFFGTAEVQRERVEWLSEDDRVAEWVSIGEAETID